MRRPVVPRHRSANVLIPDVLIPDVLIPDVLKVAAAPKKHAAASKLAAGYRWAITAE
ncbi:MAG: hypothetical protein ABGZ35_18230 [Planctomycetaceae bacterium]